MNIEQAREIDLAAFVTRLGHGEVNKGHSYEAWYLSPLRYENSASFKVDRRTNKWKDFGESLIQGDIVDFVKVYAERQGWGTLDTARALAKLAELCGGVPTVKPYTDPETGPPSQRERRYKVTSFGALTDRGLCRYLESRGLAVAVATAYLGEVHFADRETGKRFYGLGWANVQGGYEMRNPGFKTALGPKDISVFRVAGAETPGTAVFEGMTDYLSYVQLAGGNALRHAVVMNTNNLTGNVIDYLLRPETEHPIEGWLQNDEAGLRSARAIVASVPAVALQNHRYSRFNDLNDYLNRRSIEEASSDLSSVG